MIRNNLISLFAATILIFASEKLCAQNTATKETDNVVSDNDSSTYNLTIDKVDPTRFSTVAVIQGLNKITAKTSLLEIKIGDTIRFGKLNITVHKCWQAPLEQKPESKILLEIYDNEDSKTGNEKKRIFYGWMFSSSPSISALEHPIYDITAVGCKNK